jgi:hypothetical protein
MTTAAIPIDYRKRKRLWIDASLWLASNERPTIASSIWNLGYAERILLELEAEIANLASDHSMKRRRDSRLMECSAHSELWILGLYEVLRTLKQTGTPRFDPLGPLFHKLELLRMPIAKHEMPDARHEGKRVKGQATVVHYPTHFWNPETGHSGWNVFDRATGDSLFLFRTPLADEFLALAAIEPEFPPPFPIGGPLGIDED